MAWTKWHSPSAAAQLETEEISMQNYSGSTVGGFVSRSQARSISTSFGTFTREQSNSLLFTDFGFADVQPLGIQLRLRARRVARIQDKTIQLYHSGTAVSENLHKQSAEDEEFYGGADDLWGIPAAVDIPVSSQSFGVVIDLQPHQSIPCADLVLIRSVAMRLYLAE